MKFEKILECLDQQLAFLSKWGYKKVSEEVDESEFLGERLLVKYSSPQAARTLHIYFSQGMNKRPGRFSVFVDNANGKSVPLNELLKKNGREEMLEGLSNLDGLPVTNGFCEQFGAAFRDICNSELVDIISGKSWEDISIDWSPYR